ncbi:MAG: TolB-like 6-bladed beta-propeller domain-containing protein [Tannerellaceae bacterium]|nr:TolB-like 6-bladed beta-propeller domain-containing protein [Tannerellaceae bacterium]
MIKITDAYLFNDKSFQNVLCLTGNIVNDTFVGKPARLTQIDTLLYVVDASLDSLVHKFDVKNNRYKGLAISRGNAPGELLSVGHVTSSIDKKSVWVHDITSRQWHQYDRELNTLIDKISFSQDMTDHVYVNEPQWISDNLFVCLNFRSHKERFYVVNKDLTEFKPVSNPQFSFNDNLPSFLMNDIFSSLIHVKPDKKKVVLAGRYLDCIEIYNADGSLTKLLKGPEKDFNFKYDRDRSFGNGVLIKSPESRRAYICLRSTNDRIYALYSGKGRMDSSNYSTSNIIYTFDWEGNLLKKYVLDCHINSFDIDASTQTIYAIQYADNDIVSFNLFDDKTL